MEATSGRFFTNVSSRPDHPGHRLAGDELGEVDDVAGDVTECAGAGLLLLQAPDQRELGVDDPVLQVHGPDVPDVAEPALGDEPAGEGGRGDAAVVEADHRAHPVGLRPLRRQPPSREPRRPCSPAASRTARACPPAARRSPPLRGCCPGWRRRRSRCRRGRRARASRSRPKPSPSFPAASVTADSVRPHNAAISTWTGRSKKLFTVRQACECDPPMKA